MSSRLIRWLAYVAGWALVSAQEFDVIPATRVYAASVLSGELAVSGEFVK